MGKTAIVIGATGLVGQALVDQLILNSDFEKIVTLTRRKIFYISAKVENHIVDFENLDNYSSFIVGDCLFSCLGTTLKQAGSQEAQRKVDFEYQFRVAKLAAKNSVPHYLLVSSPFAQATSQNYYRKMKGELEQEVNLLNFQRISIFEPNPLLGKRQQPRLGDIISRYVLNFIKYIPLLNDYRPIYNYELAEKMIQVSLSEGNTREIFRRMHAFPKRN